MRVIKEIASHHRYHGSMQEFEKGILWKKVHWAMWGPIYFLKVNLIFSIYSIWIKKYCSFFVLTYLLIFFCFSSPSLLFFFNFESGGAFIGLSALTFYVLFVLYFCSVIISLVISTFLAVFSWTSPPIYTHLCLLTVNLKQIPCFFFHMSW